MTGTVPNALTALRLLVVPIAVALLVVDDGADGTARWWAFVLVALAAATDWLDGYLARRWEVVSGFGKLADPIADKALVLGVLACLVVVDGIAWWPLAILLVREVGVTIGRLVVASDVVIPASRGGKIKTTLQLTSLLMFLVPQAPEWVDAVAWWVLVAAAVVAIVTGVDYARTIAAAVRVHRGHAADAPAGDADGRR